MHETAHTKQTLSPSQRRPNFTQLTQWYWGLWDHNLKNISCCSNCRLVKEWLMPSWRRRPESIPPPASSSRPSRRNQRNTIRHPYLEAWETCKKSVPGISNWFCDCRSRTPTFPHLNRKIVEKDSLLRDKTRRGRPLHRFTTLSKKKKNKIK